MNVFFQGRGRKGSESSDGSLGGDAKRQNQFSFVERATQTKNNAEKVLPMHLYLKLCFIR